MGLAGARSVISLPTGVIYFLIEKKTIYFKFLFGLLFLSKSGCFLGLSGVRSAFGLPIEVIHSQNF